MNAGDPPPFDYSQPFSIDIGRAAIIAVELRGHGYPSCFADQVTAELARPEGARSPIGVIAADILRSAGWRP